MKVAGRVAVIAAIVTALGIPATGALASTPGCTAGAYLGFCATQADNGTAVLVLDSRGQGTSVNNPVIGYTDSTSDPGTDFFQLDYAGDPSLGVMFEFAPGGTLSNMCVADPGDGFLVLRGCNGSNWQRWVAAPVGTTAFFTLTNRATHRILTAGAPGAQLVTAGATATPAGNQEWKLSG
jgi:hypothetical protein